MKSFSPAVYQEDALSNLFIVIIIKRSKGSGMPRDTPTNVPALIINCGSSDRRIVDLFLVTVGFFHLRFRPAENRSIVSVSTLQELCWMMNRPSFQAICAMVCDQDARCGRMQEPRDLRNEPMVNAPVLPQLRDREMKEGESLTKVSTSVFCSSWYSWSET